MNLTRDEYILKRRGIRALVTGIAQNKTKLRGHNGNKNRSDYNGFSLLRDLIDADEDMQKIYKSVMDHWKDISAAFYYGSFRNKWDIRFRMTLPREACEKIRLKAKDAPCVMI